MTERCTLSTIIEGPPPGWIPAKMVLGSFRLICRLDGKHAMQREGERTLLTTTQELPRGGTPAGSIAPRLKIIRSESQTTCRVEWEVARHRAEERRWKVQTHRIDQWPHPHCVQSFDKGEVVLSSAGLHLVTLWYPRTIIVRISLIFNCFILGSILRATKNGDEDSSMGFFGVLGFNMSIRSC